MTALEIILQIIVPILTVVAGGGWFLTYKAYKRKANGEATQTEAEGWLKQQEVYQKTINDLDGICDKIREDRDHLREDREVLRTENEELRKKYNDMEEQMMELKKTIARLGRRIDGITPLMCGKVNCKTRIKINAEGIGDIDDTDNE